MSDKTEFEFRLLMFVTLSIEAGKWADMLVGKVNHDFKFRLQNFRGAAQALERFCVPFIDEDALQDTSEIFSRTLELISKAPIDKRSEMIATLSKFLSDVSDNSDSTPE